MSVVSAPPGIETAAVSKWFVQQIEEVEIPLTFKVISGGHSNLSYEVNDAAGHRYVLRRPPLAMLMPSAHDVLRESRVMSALRETEVPVPAVRGECRDESVTGSPFFVMDHVDGVVLREPAEVEQHLAEEQRHRLGFRLVSILAKLHDADPSEVGLSDLGRGSGYMKRQLRRWRAQWDGWKTRELQTVDEIEGWLQNNLPEHDEVTIVHGDFRLDNTIVNRHGDVAAVLDWELCTLGDPLADLGVMLGYWVNPGDEPIPHLSAATTLPGFPTGRELAAEYSRVSGRDISTIDLYLAFACWKIAIVLEGVYARYRSGALGEDHENFENIKAATNRLIEEAGKIGPGGGS